MTFLNLTRWRQRWCSHRARWTGASLRYLERRPLDPADPASPHVQHLICARCLDAVPVLNRDRAEHARMLALQPTPPVAVHFAKTRAALMAAPAYHDDRREVVRRLPAESTDLVITKPPYNPAAVKGVRFPVGRNGKAPGRGAASRSPRA